MARIKEIFAATTDLPPADRADFLAKECGSDTELRQEIEALLSADTREGTFIDRPVLSLPPDLFPETPADELLGQRFGAYEIVDRIGRGGFGTVYLARRADDVYCKEVAVKVVRRGLDTEDILDRFRHERQILAQLDHPNIARLLDGGTTAGGLPYFVMEYVPGEALLQYARTHDLNIKERLTLFLKICAAVTYAHQNLVIHRDLKPSNIIVSASGEPKLLDFGIAKLLIPEAEEITVTMPAQRALTLDYASPEQLRGEKITTATDVYSLGVILYELLSGAKPHHFTSRTPAEVSQILSEQEPLRPSTALRDREETSESETGHYDSRELRGDLDNIVLMALRKESGRRYPSAGALSEDLQRYLEGRPVLAHQDTFAYRSSKFIRRHKVGMGASVLLFLAVVAGISGTLWQSHLAHRQRVRAEKRFNDVRQLANSNLFEVYPKVEDLPGSIKARESILKNALRYLNSLASEAEDDLNLQSELATGYEKVGDVQGALHNSNLGNTKAGLETYRRANALRLSVAAARPNDLKAKEKLAQNDYTIARTLWMDNQTTEAEREFEKSLKLRRELVAAEPNSTALKNQLAVTLIDYAAIPAFNAQTKKTVRLLDEADGMIDQLLASDPGNLSYKKTKARLLRIQSKPKATLGDYAGGLKGLETALALSREVAKGSPNDFKAQRAVWLTEAMTCELFIDQGDGPRGVEIGLRAIDFPKQALAREPENATVAYDLAISYFNLARSYRLAGNFEGTVEMADLAFDVMSKLSAKSPADDDYRRNLAIYRTEKATAEIALRRPAEALADAQEAEKVMHAIVTADPGSATSLEDLGVTYQLQAKAQHQKGDDAQAIQFIDKALAVAANLKKMRSQRNSEKDWVAELRSERDTYADNSN